MLDTNFGSKCLTTISIFIALGSAVRNEQRWRIEHRKNFAKRSRIVLENLTSLSEDERRGASYATIQLLSGDRLIVGNDRERQATITQAVKLTNLSDVPLANINLTLRLRYHGGNLPFHTEEIENLAAFEVETILGGESRFISFRNLCPFPVFMDARGAHVAEGLRRATYIEIVNNWYIAFSGEDSDFNRDSLIDSHPRIGEGTISQAIVERSEFFFTFKCRESVLAFATVEGLEDDEAQVIFTYTRYGVSPVNNAETFIEEFEKREFLPPKVKRRYFAYFPSTNPQFRHLAELKYFGRQMTFPHLKIPIESKNLRHLDEVVWKLNEKFDPIISQSSM